MNRQPDSTLTWVKEKSEENLLKRDNERALRPRPRSQSEFMRRESSNMRTAMAPGQQLNESEKRQEAGAKDEIKHTMHRRLR